jgi:hypothetical protein
MTFWTFFHSAVLLILACMDLAILFFIFRPGEAKAGPNWFWRFGRFDPIRNIFFRADGSFRRYGRPVVSIILIGVLAALFYLLASLWG